MERCGVISKRSLWRSGEEEEHQQTKRSWYFRVTCSGLITLLNERVIQTYRVSSQAQRKWRPMRPQKCQCYVQQSAGWNTHLEETFVNCTTCSGFSSIWHINIELMQEYYWMISGTYAAEYGTASFVYLRMDLYLLHNSRWLDWELIAFLEFSVIRLDHLVAFWVKEKNSVSSISPLLWVHSTLNKMQINQMCKYNKRTFVEQCAGSHLVCWWLMHEDERGDIYTATRSLPTRQMRCDRLLWFGLMSKWSNSSRGTVTKPVLLLLILLI